MSTLKAEVVKVEVAPHPNADRLDLCKIVGKSWQCVAQKGQYKTGDFAIYLPIDSVLPQELVTKLGIEKMYHKRIRTVKLRGYISQGMLAPLSLAPYPVSDQPLNERLDLTKALGITKYEEPIPIEMAGKLLPDEPGMLRYTDIENIKNYPDVFSPNEIVVITEKIHGSNFRAAKLGGKLFVGSHTRNLVRDESNLYWRAAALLGLDDWLLEGEQVFGEVYGNKVQDLSYGCKPGEIKVAVFDIFRDGQFLGHEALLAAAESRKWKTAPLLHRGFFRDFQMPKESVLCPGQIIEGAIIRPLEEGWSNRLQGRLILKSLSDEYLLRKDGTERH
jgi:RNA ligase (TIGR02306 family)